LRGHGENGNVLDDGIVKEISDCIDFCRQFGRVTAIGHSLGGRLVLSSSADFAIGISPALATEYSFQTQSMLKNLRQYRVQESYQSVLFDIIRDLPGLKQSKEHSLILYGTRDVPEIVEYCKNLPGNIDVDVNVVEIANAFHNDIYLLEKTFSVISNQLNIWYP